MRLPALVLLALALTRSANAQAASSDLWRVAEGTLVSPAALADDGLAPIWNPASTLAPGGPGVRLGAEAVHSPSEIGVNGGLVAASFRSASVGTVSLSYGRMGISDIVYTETSPEASGGTIPIYSQVISFGIARPLTRVASGGFALRFLTGRLDRGQNSRIGLDFGVQLATGHVRFGAVTQFLDPSFGSAARSAAYNLGAEARSGTFAALGAPGTVTVRYGLTALEGESAQHLLAVELGLARVLTLDLGASREATASDVVWRSRFALGLGAGRYRIRIDRDGGVNGFGATYGFALTALFR